MSAMGLGPVLRDGTAEVYEFGATAAWMPRSLVPTALVIDDDRDILGLVRFRLNQSGFDVRTESDGDSGLLAAVELRPDVMVVDWLLPGRSGLEICVAVRADPRLRDVPVLMLSARDQEADVEWGYAAGVNDYIAKPFDSADLVRRVSAALNRRSG